MRIKTQKRYIAQLKLNCRDSAKEKQLLYINMEARSTLKAQSRLWRVLTCCIPARFVFAWVDIILFLLLQQLHHLYLSKYKEEN